MKLNHLGIQSFLCKVCDIRFPQKPKFTKHLTSDEHIAKCKENNFPLTKFFEDLKTLEEDKSQTSFSTFEVTQGAPEKINIKGGVRDRSSANGSKENGSGQKRRHCLVCYKKFSSITKLFEHKKTSHTYCSVCDSTVKNAMTFMRHVDGIKHKQRCRNRGIDPEAFLHSLRAADIEEDEDDMDFSLTLSEAVTTVSSSKSAENQTSENKSQDRLGIFDQLLDHQYQSQIKPVEQTIVTLDTDVERAVQTITNLNEDGKDGDRPLVIEEQPFPVRLINNTGPRQPQVVSGGVQPQVQVLSGGAQTRVEVREAQPQVQVLSDISGVIPSHSQIEVLQNMSDADGVEYVVISIPNDSLQTTEDGMLLLSDPALNSLL